MKKNLIWFRNDLRLHDHTALHEACKVDTESVIALFISTPEQWKNHFISAKKITFIYYHLMSLQKDLLKLNIILHYHESTNFLTSVEYLMYFCSQHKISTLFYNYQYEFNERYRDCLVKKKLSLQGVSVKGFHDNILISYKTIHNNKNQAYKVFSFFKKKIVQNLHQSIPKCFPIPKKRQINKDFFYNLLSFTNLYCQFDSKVFPIGEIAAAKRLKHFCINKMHDYSSKRNFPCLDGTSMLSPYLSSGILSSRYCLMMILQQQKNKSSNMFFTSSWLNQILWREFYYHLLISFPQLSQNQALSIWEKKINWCSNIAYFNAWKEGNTGFPIVDAGMRQLNKLGWMHNRLRMITSSFLVKNLFIDWREGEKYFISRLIDGDFALNNGGWQWSASIGCDSVPYIRILNPLNQSKTFDTSGIFIKKFIPELKNVPNQYIHKPHEWSEQNKYKIDYPKPIIDYTNSRKKFLLMLNRARLNVKK